MRDYLHPAEDKRCHLFPLHNLSSSLLTNEAAGEDPHTVSVILLENVLIIHERDKILVRNVWYISMEHSFEQYK